MFALHGQIWVEIVNMISNIENESTCKKNSEHGKIVFQYKKYIQIFTVTYFGPMYTMLFVMMGFFWGFCVLKPIIMKSDKALNYFFLCMVTFCSKYTIWTCYIGNTSNDIRSIYDTSTCAMTWDTLMLSCMIFFTGQLKALRARFVQALNSPDEKQYWTNIIKCHQHHLAIVR